MVCVSLMDIGVEMRAREKGGLGRAKLKNVPRGRDIRYLFEEPLFFSLFLSGLNSFGTWTLAFLNFLGDWLVS